MPQPAKGEPLKKFIGRFMGSAESEKSFPNQKQRAAVAYSEFKARQKKRK
jgi:hypothetical protein